MRCVPIACTMVTIEPNASGIAATARATANIRDSSIGVLRYKLRIKTNAQISMIIAARRLPNWSKLTCRGVFFSSAAFIIAAIFPISVSMPVAVTTALALPPVMREPEKIMLLCSAKGTGELLKVSDCFSTLSDSPVRELSFTIRLWHSKILPSATTRSPASKRRMSPGTTREDGISMVCPSRRTRAAGEDKAFRLFRDFWAF